MTQVKIQFPEMRAEMLNYLHLVGKIRQNQEAPSADEDLEYIVHYFFDDTEVAKNPTKYVDVTLMPDEVSVVGKFGDALNEYLEEVSPGNSPLRFVDGKEWQSVQTAALLALRQLEKSKTA